MTEEALIQKTGMTRGELISELIEDSNYTSGQLENMDIDELYHVYTTDGVPGREDFFSGLSKFIPKFWC